MTIPKLNRETLDKIAVNMLGVWSVIAMLVIAEHHPIGAGLLFGALLVFIAYVYVSW